MITESSTAPATGDAGWSSTSPTSYTLESFADSKILYAWAKDGAGHVSSIRSATATLSKPVQLLESAARYASLQTAYNVVSSNSATIEAWATLLIGSVTFDHNRSITLKGGYDMIFGNTSGTTTVDGTFTVTAGTLIVDSVTIR